LYLKDKIEGKFNKRFTISGVDWSLNSLCCLPSIFFKSSLGIITPLEPMDEPTETM